MKEGKVEEGELTVKDYTAFIVTFKQRADGWWGGGGGWCQEKAVYFIIGGILLISYREKYLKGARKGGLEEGVGKGRKLLPSNDTWR